MRKFVIIVSLLVASSVQAQGKPFKVAQGSVTGTYGNAFEEIEKACSTNDLPLVAAFPDKKGDGAANLNALLQNQANAAFVRSDLVFFRSMSEGLQNIKTLFSLWPEEVHVLALANSKTVVTSSKQVDGMLFGKKTVTESTTRTFSSFTDLAGARVGAAGANEITANILRSQSGVDFQVVPMAGGKEALAALDAGQVDAIIFTAGQPLPNLVSITSSTHKLLPIPGNIADKLKGVYRPANLYYSKMSPTAIPTVASDALFVTREYKTPEKIKQLAQLRACFYKKLDELKDDGVNPYWQKVEATNKGTWSNWYDLPKVK